MNLKIVGLQSHEDHKSLAYTVMFDDLDRGRRMVATVTEAAVIDSAAHPDCEAIDVEAMARGRVHSEKYEIEAIVRVIKKFRDEANRQHRDS